jgi:hypothetical protein
MPYSKTRDISQKYGGLWQSERVKSWELHLSFLPDQPSPEEPSPEEPWQPN